MHSVVWLKRLRAVLATIVVLTVVAVVATSQRTADQTQTLEYTLDDNVRRMLSAAQQGDVAAYLDCFCGDLRQKLAARLSRLSNDQAAAELRGDAQGLKSFVTTDWKTASPDQASLILERIYADYNERHLVRLERVDTEWRIAALTPQERFVPDIPYGTPVYAPPTRTAPATRTNSTIDGVPSTSHVDDRNAANNGKD